MRGGGKNKHGRERIVGGGEEPVRRKRRLGAASRSSSRSPSPESKSPRVRFPAPPADDDGAGFEPALVAYGDEAARAAQGAEEGEEVVEVAGGSLEPRRRGEVVEVEAFQRRRRFERTLVEHARSGDTAQVAALLRPGAGVDVNMAEPATKCTPLHYAVYYGREDIVRLLLAHPAVDVNAANSLDVTPVQWAVERRRPDLVRLLLEHGAAADRSCAYRCALNSDRDVLDLLLAQPSRRALFEDFVHVSEETFEPVFHAAVASSAVAFVAALLDAGVDVNLTNDRRRTDIASEPTRYSALHRAVISNRPDTLALLLDRGADPERRDQGNRTALHWACATMNYECTRALLRYPLGNMSDGDVAGLTPLDLVVRNERNPLWEPMLRLLQPHYPDEVFFHDQAKEDRERGALPVYEDELSLEAILRRLHNTLQK